MNIDYKSTESVLNVLNFVFMEGNNIYDAEKVIFVNRFQVPVAHKTI